MADYDGEIRIRTLIETGKASSQLLQLEAKFQKLAKESDQLTGELRKLGEMKIPTEEYKNLQNTFDLLVAKGRRLSEELKNTEKYVPTKTYKEAEAALDRVSGRQDQLNRKMQEWVALGRKTNSVSYRKMQMEMADCEKESDRLIDALNRMEKTGTDRQINDKWKDLKSQMQQAGSEAAKVKAQMRDMEESGTANVDPKGTAEYQKKAEKLYEVNRQLDVTKKKMEEVAAKESKVGSGAKQIEKVGKAAKKSAGLMSTFLSRLKGITLSLLVFNWITKGFNAMVSAFKDGIQNMAKYSGSFNSKMSEMKSATATLKASLGTLSAPIISAIVPAIVTLCNWLTTAINKINELIATLSGKSTWTKAKNQTTDYAKSLDKTSSAAKKAAGALAAFDDLNVLQKNDSGSGGSANTSDLYEEVPTGESLSKKLQPFLDYLKKIKTSVEKGWKDTWAKLDISSQLDNIKKSAQSIRDSLVNIFTDNDVLSSADNFIQTLATSLGSISASVISIGATIAENLLGGLSIYLENNSESIKNYIINMFDIASDVAQLTAEGMEAFANVFSAFGDENGQELTANLVQIFSDTFMMITENAAKFARDVIDCIVTPFVENQDSMKQALDGFLGVLASLTGTISDMVSQIKDKLTELYDDHIHPFIENIKNGISELLNTFLEFWNTYMQPLLDELAVKVQDTYDNYLKPVIDNVIDIIGLVIDIINDLWTNVLQPLINWIIENILPIVVPILEEMSTTVKEKIDTILVIINGLLSGIKFVLSVIKKLFETDWKQVFNSAKATVKNFANNVITMIEHMVNKIINGINALISGFNSIGFDMPDWLGGGSWHPSIPTIPTVSLPRLANGGITTGRTLAEIGEAGREAVLPLENNTGWMDDLASKLASKMPDYSGAKTVVLAIDGKEFARINLPYLQDEEIRLGIAEG